jgi:HK97 family phage major capsid protein
MKTSVVALPKQRKPLAISGLRPGMAFADTTASGPTNAEIMAAFREFRNIVEQFKAQNDKDIAELKAGRSDVVTREHTDRINAAVTAAQEKIDALAIQIAAQRTAAPADGNTPEIAAYKRAFETWARTGEGERELHALAVKASMTTDSKPDGGYFVAPEVDRAITRAVGLRSAVRGLSTVITIGTSNFKKHHNLGGAGSGWVGEREARPSTSTPTFVELDWPVHEMYANPQASQNALDDAYVSLESLLADEAAIAFAEKEGLAFISGSGIKQPKGFLSETIVANGSYAWGKLGYVPTGVATDLSDGTHNGVDALYDVIYALNAAYTPGATWLMNRTTSGVVRKLKDANDNYLWEPRVQVGAPDMLGGYPVAFDDQMPNVGAGKYPIAFGDFKRGFLIVDRAGITTLRDPYTNKPFVGFYMTRRVGGHVWDFAAIKLLKVAAS